LLGGERTGDDRPPQPHGLAGQSGIGVEAELPAPRSPVAVSATSSISFVPASYRAKAHVLPRDEPARRALEFGGKLFARLMSRAIACDKP